MSTNTIQKFDPKHAMTNLHPCPFCGEIDSIHIRTDESQFYNGSCPRCGSEGPVVTDEGQGTAKCVVEAMEGWNTRSRQN